MMERFHFISIGGSVMHSLAIALSNKGCRITGSDDEIYDPSRSLLSAHGLLPRKMGWHAENIHSGLDAVVLGMHARPDNPELIAARELSLPIYSFPEFIRQSAEDKQRIVIAGSHGKTTITSMIMHVLQHHGRSFDYLVGAQVPGFDNIVRLSDAPVIVMEGDEYFSSALDHTPKFLKYEHHIGLISGIAWDHINAYNTFDEYVRQFELFADATPKAGTLVFCEDDNLAMMIASNERADINQIHYHVHPYEVINNTCYLITNRQRLPLRIFGRHNMLNLNGARMVLQRLGITDDMFYQAIVTFEGARKRLQLLRENRNTAVFVDFAHAPSKVEATTEALKERYRTRKLTACLELHTFSSLNREFIRQYEDTLAAADHACVFFNPNNKKQATGTAVGEDDIQEAFRYDGLRIFTDTADMVRYLRTLNWREHNLLMMSSGNFAQLDLGALAADICP
jgi:UDP-N-acetylmuramate: L-alanyl-gamma-D-glutamyl-meso-diaminopimelate ligase